MASSSIELLQERLDALQDSHTSLGKGLLELTSHLRHAAEQRGTALEQSQAQHESVLREFDRVTIGIKECKQSADGVTTALNETRVDVAKRQGAPWSLVWVLTVTWMLLVLVMVGLYAQANGDDAGKAIQDAKSGLSGISPSGGTP